MINKLGEKMIKSIWYFVKMAFLIFIAVFLILFIAFNSSDVVLYLFPLSYRLEVKLFVLITGCLIVGFVLGLIISAKNILKTNINTVREVRKLEKELDEAEEASKNLNQK